MSVSVARAFWQRFETLHAVTYFAPESIAAAKDAGLKGFWMGYFGFRPLRSDPWRQAPSRPPSRTSPLRDGAAVASRRLGAGVARGPSRHSGRELAARALRRAAPDVETSVELNDELRSLSMQASVLGRPMYAANRSVGVFDDPVQELWQQCTTLREQRGDGHVAALAVHAVDGVEAHHPLAAGTGIDPETFFANRGWTADERDAGRVRLVDRGCCRRRAITAAGAELRSSIESLTDELAVAAPLSLVERLDGVARSVVASGVLPFPNPMGLPAVDAQV
ncbi:MAG: hypothetical protein R2710_10255 [Acidimicrobiales bacterium]